MTLRNCWVEWRGAAGGFIAQAPRMAEGEAFPFFRGLVDYLAPREGATARLLRDGAVLREWSAATGLIGPCGECGGTGFLRNDAWAPFWAQHGAALPDDPHELDEAAWRALEAAKRPYRLKHGPELFPCPLCNEVGQVIAVARREGVAA